MAGDDSFSFDTVAVLVAALKEKGVTLSMKEYNIMSALDGKRGASAFDHQFRKVKKRAEELMKNKIGDSSQATPVKPAARKGGKKATACDDEGTPTGKKRGRKNQDAEVEDDGESPTKKIKSEEVEEGGLAGAEDEYEFV